MVFYLHWLILFQLIVRLNPECDCCSSFVINWVDRVTTGTKSFVSVIVNVSALVKSVIKQFCNQVIIRLISKLINGISRVLQEFLKSLNGTKISKSFVLPASGVLFAILPLNLNDSESVIL